MNQVQRDGFRLKIHYDHKAWRKRKELAMLFKPAPIINKDFPEWKLIKLG